MLALPSSIVSRVSRSVCGGRPFAAPLRQLPSHPQALKLVRRLCADAGPKKELHKGATKAAAKAETAVAAAADGAAGVAGVAGPKGVRDAGKATAERLKRAKFNRQMMALGGAVGVVGLTAFNIDAIKETYADVWKTYAEPTKEVKERLRAARQHQQQSTGQPSQARAAGGGGREKRASARQAARQPGDWSGGRGLPALRTRPFSLSLSAGFAPAASPPAGPAAAAHAGGRLGERCQLCEPTAPPPQRAASLGSSLRPLLRLLRCAPRGCMPQIAAFAKQSGVCVCVLPG